MSEISDNNLQAILCLQIPADNSLSALLAGHQAPCLASKVACSLAELPGPVRPKVSDLGLPGFLVSGWALGSDFYPTMAAMETPQTTPKTSRWARRLAWGLGSLTALMALSWVAVPPLLKSQAEKYASEQLGRKLTVSSIDFKPWTLELEIKDLALAQAGGQGEQLKIGRAYVNAELQSLLRLAPVVDAVEIEGVRGSLVHLGNGKYDIDDMLAKIAALPTSPEPPSSEPPKFAIYNITLKDWALQFDDRPAGKKHEIKDFQLSLPFLSTLEAQREVKTEPRLAFALNGSRLDSTGQSTPFVQTRKTDASVSIKALDLAPYLPYLPKGLPVQPVSAVIGADLKIAFEQNPKPTVRITGQVTGQGIALNDAAGQALLGVQTIQIIAKDVQPLAGRVALDAIEITAPSLQLKRSKDGQINLLAPSTSSAENTPKSIALRADSMPANGTKSLKNPAAASASAVPWQISIERVSLLGGSVTWSDETTTPRAQLAATALNLQAKQIGWPFAASDPQPIAFEGSSFVEQGSLTFSGTATDAKASVSAQLSAMPLAAFAPYLQPVLITTLTGSADVQAGLLWQAQRGDQKAALQITLPKAQLSNLQLAQNKTKLAQIKQISAQAAQIDLQTQSVKVQKIAVSGVQTLIERSAQGRWMTQDWLRTSSVAASAPQTSATSADWKISLADIELDAPQLAFIDRLPTPTSKKTVALDIAQLKARASGIELLGSELGKKPIPINLSLNLAQGDAQATAPAKVAADAGQIKLQGQLALEPLALQLEGQLQHLPIHAVEPYFGEALNIDLLRLDASYNGKFQLTQTNAGLQIKLAGDAVLEELQTTLRGAALAASSGGVAGDELLNWRALSVKALAVDVTPGAPLKVDVGEAALTDFFARILVSEQGRINLSDIVKSDPAASTTTVNTTNTIALRADSMSATGTKSLQNASASTSPEPVINIGQVSLINGKVFFSDRFIKPNYAANLSELTGKLGAFSSQPVGGTVQMAPLELRGKAEGTAQLEILGQLNPLAKPLALDITGKVRDLELAPLSPYSVKYAGHGIERGKLSVDVKYLVKPDGQLTASNNIVLNQIKFGDKVEGAPNSLPVKLAVALLADRNGVIDINLPIQGSLNDPQFSIGPIVFKLIINLVIKAITSPFSLLASAFGGGGDELNQVAFNSGGAQIAESAKPGLEKIIKALQDRPALKMTVVGQASAEVEREAYKKERLKALVAAEKRRSIVSSGAGASVNLSATQTAAITVSDTEYPALLKEVYKRSDVPKPRNAIGFVKDIPAPEMEALLLANLPVTEQAMQELATARGVAVRDYLASKGLPSDRLFLGAAKAVPNADKWTPRAELSLAAQ